MNVLNYRRIKRLFSSIKLNLKILRRMPFFPKVNFSLKAVNLFFNFYNFVYEISCVNGFLLVSYPAADIKSITLQ